MRKVTWQRRGGQYSEEPLIALDAPGPWKVTSDSGEGGGERQRMCASMYYALDTGVCVCARARVGVWVCGCVYMNVSDVYIVCANVSVQSSIHPSRHEFMHTSCTFTYTYTCTFTQVLHTGERGKGWGLYAARPIREGEYLGHYSGQVVSH